MAGIVMLLGCVACTPRAAEEAVPDEIREGVHFTLASRFRVDPGRVRLVSWERVVWPDECLGIPLRGPCRAAETPGYRLEAEIDGRAYEYRAPASDPLYLMLADGPDAELSDPVLVWEGQDDGRCEGLRVAADEWGAFGPCGGPQTKLRLLEGRNRPEEVMYFANRFAPFAYETPGASVRLAGSGGETADPAWQRAVATWGRLVYPELASGRSGASWGTAFVLQRERPDQPGYCDFLTVVEYGKAFASSARCEGGDARDLGQGWLEAEWEAFDRWYYRYAPHTDPSAGVHFFGAGTEAMGEAEVAALQRWAEAAFARIAGGRAGSS